MKIILCGYNWIGCKILDKLIELGHDIYVYTHPSEKHVPSLSAFCEKRNINFTFDKIEVDNLPFKPDYIFSIYYRYLISDNVINFVNGKIINLHPSLLPKYRGCSSLTWAIIEGEKQAGFTYHYINSGIDTGNIILQQTIKIEDFDTQLSLYYKVMYEAAEFFSDVLSLLENNFKGIEQKGETSFHKRGCPHDAVIDPSWKLEKIERFIRAMIFPPYKPATYKNKEIYSLNDYKSIKEREDNEKDYNYS